MESEIPTQPKTEFTHEPIADLEVPIRNIINQIKPALDNNAYGAILVEDTSGRIPGLILAEIINSYNQTKGFEKIPIFFIQGSGFSGHIANIKTELSKRQMPDLKSTGSKALVVTDTISSGNTLRNLYQAFRSNHNFMQKLKGDTIFDYDVAAANSILTESELKRRSILPKNSRLFSGDGATHKILAGGTSIYGRHHLTGLSRKKFQEPTKENKHPKILKEPGARTSVVQARADVHTLADKLLNQLITTAAQSSKAA